MLQDLARPFECFSLEFPQWYHGIYQAHFQRLLCIVLPAEIPDLTRLLLADDPRQIARTEAAVEGADLRAGLTEFRVVRRDGEIAHHVQHMPAPDGIARDHGNHRLGNAADFF